MQFFRELSLGRRRLAVVLVLVLTIVVAVAAVNRTHRLGDYDVNREFGAELLRGNELYRNGLCYNYMPISAVYYVPLALLPAWLGSILRSAVGLACLIYCVRSLNDAFGTAAMRSAQRTFDIAAGALLLSLHYVVRDLDDGGPHLIFLGMLAAGFNCFRRGRSVAAGAWFGLSIALKMTPGLLLPYFVWKRQFRVAAFSAISAAAWIVSPLLVMGPANWWSAQEEWTRVALRSVFGTADENELRIQNQALKPAVLRWTTAYPGGHPLKLDHPLDVPLFDLNPTTSKRIANLVLLGGLVGFGWWTRRSYRTTDAVGYAYEFAALLLLMTLYSPVTWLQHLAWTIPATWLIARSFWKRGDVASSDGGHVSAVGWNRAACATLGLYLLFSLGLNREILGRDNYFVLLSWHMHTICQLLLIGMLAYARGRDGQIESQATIVDDAGPQSVEMRPRRAA